MQAIAALAPLAPPLPTHLHGVLDHQQGCSRVALGTREGAEVRLKRAGGVQLCQLCINMLQREPRPGPADAGTSCRSRCTGGTALQGLYCMHNCTAQPPTLKYAVSRTRPLSCSNTSCSASR